MSMSLLLLTANLFPLSQDGYVAVEGMYGPVKGDVGREPGTGRRFFTP